jgi:hypothetical protein
MERYKVLQKLYITLSRLHTDNNEFFDDMHNKLSSILVHERNNKFGRLTQFSADYIERNFSILHSLMEQKMVFNVPNLSDIVYIMELIKNQRA